MIREPVALRPPWYEGRFARWLVTTDHKQIGILYISTSLIFFVGGGILAMLMRGQLATPNEHFITRDHYNELFTLHGTVMVFLVVVPILAGFGNFLVPLMIGARDVAFPRLNAMSYWFFLFGGLTLFLSFFAIGRRGEVRLDVLRAALGDAVLARPRRRSLDPVAAPADDRVARRRDQLHRDDPQHAHRRDDVDADAALRLDDRDLRGDARLRAARAVGGADDAAARPPRRHALLRSRRRAAAPSSGSTSSGSSATPRSTS